MDKSTGAILEQIVLLARCIEETQRIADSENKKRAAQIELLGKHISKINLGHDATTKLGSFITMDESNTSNNQRKRPPVKPNQTDDMDSEEEAVSCDNPTYNAKTCLDFIPILNGQDDIGVGLLNG